MKDQKEIDVAAGVMQSLIEQSNGLGNFKKLSDLDHVRRALDILVKAAKLDSADVIGDRQKTDLKFSAP